MRKKIISLLCSLALVGGLFASSANEVRAEGEKMVDGSYLTEEESSTGYSSNSLSRGKYLMDGESSITKSGTGRVYCYGCTTANTDVERLVLTIRLEQYDEETETWHVYNDHSYQIEAEDDFVLSYSRSFTVARGYYYRVRCDHFAGPKDGVMDSCISLTNGIRIW